MFSVLFVVFVFFWRGVLSKKKLVKNQEGRHCLLLGLSFTSLNLSDADCGSHEEFGLGFLSNVKEEIEKQPFGGPTSGNAQLLHSRSRSIFATQPTSLAT